MINNVEVYTDIILYGKRAKGAIVITKNRLIHKSYVFDIKKKMLSTNIAEQYVAEIACKIFDNVYTDSFGAYRVLANQGYDINLISGRENLADRVIRDHAISDTLEWCSACRNHQLSYVNDTMETRCCVCKNTMTSNQHAGYFLRPFGKKIKHNSRINITPDKEHINSKYTNSIHTKKKAVERRMIHGNRGLYNLKWNISKYIDVKVLPEKDIYADKLR